MIHHSESFAALIEERMRALELNQVELERRSSITDTSWAGWRAGALPKVKAFIPLIAQTLEVSVEEVVEVIARDRASRPKPGARVDTVPQAREWADKNRQPTPAAQGG